MRKWGKPPFQLLRPKTLESDLNIFFHIHNQSIIILDFKHISQRRQWHPTPVLLPGKSHGRGRLVGCSPWGREQSDRTERLHFHFSLSCIGEGNGNPLQCSYLENPWDGGAWWAAVHGVAQSRTQLKQLSSSSRTYLKPFSQLCVSSIHRQLL